MVYWDEIQVRYQIKKIAETEEGRKNLCKVLQDMDLECQSDVDSVPPSTIPKAPEISTPTPPPGEIKGDFI